MVLPGCFIPRRSPVTGCARQRYNSNALVDNARKLILAPRSYSLHSQCLKIRFRWLDGNNYGRLSKL